MKVFGLQATAYRGAALASRLTALTPGCVAVRRDALRRWHQARAQGLTAEQAAQAIGLSRASLYRWDKDPQPRSRAPRRRRTPLWSPALAAAVEQARLAYPMWGKRKIAVLLARQGLATSVSTVGRILQRLIRRGRVIAVPLLRRRPSARRFRLIGPQRHARRLPKGHKPNAPGQLVQVDTLFVNVAPDRAIKHFTAYDPVAKWTTAVVARTASARSASALIERLIQQAPFPIRGIQVDGGSEFQAEFEQACRDNRLELYVLPPKRPQLNGAVERAQSTWRYEFYACHELPARIDQLQPHVDRFAHHFNHLRPHQALGNLAPAEYLSSPTFAADRPSQIP